MGENLSKARKKMIHIFVWKASIVFQFYKSDRIHYGRNPSESIRKIIAICKIESNLWNCLLRMNTLYVTFHIKNGIFCFKLVATLYWPLDLVVWYKRTWECSRINNICVWMKFYLLFYFVYFIWVSLLSRKC